MALKQPVAGPSRLRGPASAHAPPPHPSLAAFDESHARFALAIPALGSADKVCIWDATTDTLLFERELEGASKACALCWTPVPPASGPAKKKRRKSGRHIDYALAVALESGGALIISATDGQVLSRLDSPKKILGIARAGERLLAASSDAIYLISEDATSISTTFPLPPHSAAPSSLAILPTSTSTVLHVLLAKSSVSVLHLDLPSGKLTYTSPSVPVSTSSVTALRILPPTSQGLSFLVVADDDRTISQYILPSAQSVPKLAYRYASPTLSGAHSIAISDATVSVLHASGEVSVFPLPTEVDIVRPKSDSKPSTIRLVEGEIERPARVCGITYAPKNKEVESTLLCGRMVGAGRVKWIPVDFEPPREGTRPSVTVKCDAQDLVNGARTENVTSLQRYAAPTKVTEAPNDADGPESSAALSTDVDMADLSLGERLLALPNGDAAPNGDAPSSSKLKPTKLPELEGPVNAASLTRILVQALHTSDTALLTVCLTHKNPTLIRNTIRKMPAQMALPLLKACVERLGQGKGSNSRTGGKGVAQNEQQARGTVEWVKGVLVERGTLLMTMPSLPLHLAQLSQLLSSRLQLNQPLLALSGRLDLALAQISMRRIAAEQTHGVNGLGEKSEGVKYVEGESDDEEVPVEADEEGEVEDVDMRANGSSDESDEDEEEEEDSSGEGIELDGDGTSEAEESDDDPLESGDEDVLLDLEAEESEGDGSGSEEDEDE